MARLQRVVEFLAQAGTDLGQDLDEDGNVIDEWEDTPDDFGRIAATAQLGSDLRSERALCRPHLLAE